MQWSMWSMTAPLPPTSILPKPHSIPSQGAYCKYGVADSGPLFLRPGNISLYLSASYGNDIVTFGLITLPDARPATYYRVTLEAATSDNGIVSVTASTSDGLPQYRPPYH